MTTPDRKSLERAWAELNAYKDLSEDARHKWQNHKYVSRVMLHVGKQLVLWEQFLGEARLLEVFTVEDVEITPTEGFEVLLQNRKGECQWVSQTPTQLMDTGVFVWTPYFQDLSWTPHPASGNFNLRFSLVIRSGGSPERLEEGVTFLTDAAIAKNLIK